MNPDIQQLVDELLPVLGAAGVLTGAAVSQRAAGIWRTDTITAPVIFRPRDTAEVAAVLSACHKAGQSVVTHGGLTGLVEGALTSAADVVLSTERMSAVESLNPTDRTLCVQAGVRLQDAQEQAAAAGLLLALDLGARGSCTIGGNVATNAGGNQVIRYGMTRDAVLGLEAVLADGTVISSLNTMLKNNAGYDLKQLFIGTEGTLGVVTRVVLRLRPACNSQETALVACSDFSQVSTLLNILDKQLAGTLSAFELFWQDYYELVTNAGSNENPPLAHGYPFYVLIEAQGADAAADRERFLQVLGFAAEQGALADAAICKSGAERNALWALRDNVELTLAQGPALIFDVSLPLSAMEAYVGEVVQRLDQDFAANKTWVFGHAGDGNLHFVVVPEATGVRGAPTVEQRHKVEQAVYEPLQNIGGSVSGEHGIGKEKKRWLHVSRSKAELVLMRRLKVALDPDNILNPGLVF
jgi:FAD/FMN-containing dehydrogenase